VCRSHKPGLRPMQQGCDGSEHVMPRGAAEEGAAAGLADRSAH
jgi:hypothetical protein